MMFPDTRSSLLEAAENGSSEAMHQLLELVSTFIAYRVARLRARFRMVGAAEADDAAADALRNVWDAIQNKKFRHPGRPQHAFHRYVNAIVSNAFYDQCRVLRGQTNGVRRVRRLDAGEDEAAPAVLSREPDPAEVAEDADRAERNTAWCMAIALKSLAMARGRYVDPLGDDRELRLLAWQAYCLLTFEAMPRREIVDQLRRRYPSAGRYRGRLTEKWVSAEAHKIRTLNARCFLEACAEVGYEISEDEMREGLEALADGTKVQDLRAQMRRAVEGDISDLIARWCERASSEAKRREERDGELRASGQMLRASASDLSRAGGGES